MEEEEKEQPFTVTDRRTSSAEGPAEGEKDSVVEKEAPAENKEKITDNAEVEQEKPSVAGEHDEAPGQFPEVDFTSFILSLATTAQMSLGVIPNPETKEAHQNLPAAKQMIDILGMLKEKTASNLNEQEQTLLEQALYGLRMQYVKMMEPKQ